MTASTAPRRRRSLGARLTAGYAAFFLLSTAALFAFAYVLLADSLRARDRAAVLGEGGELEAATHGDRAQVLAELRAIEAELGVPPFAMRLAGPDGPAEPAAAYWATRKRLPWT